MLNNVFRVLAGIIGGVIPVVLLVSLCNSLFPQPPRIDNTDPIELAAFISSLPIPAFLLIIVAHSLGAFMAGLIASKISSHNKYNHGRIAAAFILLFVTMTTFSIPGQPNWMLIIDPLFVIIFGWSGSKLGSKQTARLTKSTS